MTFRRRFTPDRVWPNLNFGYAMRMIEPDALRNVGQWTDEELVEQYRILKAETVYDDDGYPNEMERPGEIVEDEITRRGLMPDREDIVPEPYEPGS